MLRSRGITHPLSHPDVLHHVMADVLAWWAGLLVAALLSFGGGLDGISLVRLAVAGFVAAAGQIALGTWYWLYQGRFRFGSFDEVAGLLQAVAWTSLLLVLLDLSFWPQRFLPLRVVFAGSVLALLVMAGARYAWRWMRERRSRPGPSATRILVFGLGEAALPLVTSMLRDPLSPFIPVALLDDDPYKRHLQVMGVPVVGVLEDLAEAARTWDASTLVIAIPSADNVLLRRVMSLADPAGIAVKVLPPVADLLGERPAIADIRDIDLVDLLGRRQVETGLDEIAHYLTGQRVLVTGAGGSIGSELCRQLVQYAPERLIMLDRDESALHGVQLSINGRALLDSDDTVLADLRDVERIQRIFEQHRPDVIFHAAALKHLPLLEQYPGEAVKSNVWGTLTVLQAAAAAGVTRLVNISTDKAAAPISVLGYSKRIAERLTAYQSLQTPGATYLSVRFGNVLGSRGSVLTSFRSQIASGGPITVTSPEVTRYFMTVQEAVQLVIQAGAIGRPGEALVLDMGRPVLIADVARRLADEASRHIEIVYTGLRPGEKLHEDLLAPDELDDRPIHPLVSHVPVPPLDPVQALELDPWEEPVRLVASLRELCLAESRSVRSHEVVPLPRTGPANVIDLVAAESPLQETADLRDR